MIKRLLLAAIAVGALASTAYTLTLLDQIVHGTLYFYGLNFSYDWANSYWAIFRATLALLAISAAATVLNTLLVFRSDLEEEKQDVKTAPTQETIKNIPVTTQIKERTPIPSTASSPQTLPKPTPTEAPASSYASPSGPRLFKCTHCGKAFTQPLRVLDFQSDPPRIVNVCPFCSENLPSAAAEESEQIRNRSPSNKNNNHAQKPLTR